jgi:hypothetical protein
VLGSVNRRLYLASNCWPAEAIAPAGPLRDLHFPVRGRRYRPALEDVIEFLVVEKLAGRDQAGRRYSARRDDFRWRHLRAAIRRDMVTAWQAVQDFDA